MTKMEIMMAFDVSGVEEEKFESLDGVLIEKIYKCDEEEYSELCELMEKKGYYNIRFFPFCAKSDDEEDLKKALSWISDNSQFIKNLVEETGVNIQLVIKFLVKRDSIFDLFAGYPLELILSSNDLDLLKDHNIDLKVTAEYSDYIEDDENENDEEDDFGSMFNTSTVEDSEECEGVDTDNQDFTVKSGVLTEYKGAGGDVIIPAGVKNIGWNAFENYKSVKTIVIPDGVERIGYCAFYECSYLLSVNIPDSVTIIEEAAFSGCKNLKDINIPNTVKEIQDDVFFGCDNLTIHTPAGSYAEQYAKENNIPFVAE